MMCMCIFSFKLNSLVSESCGIYTTAYVRDGFRLGSVPNRVILVGTTCVLRRRRLCFLADSRLVDNIQRRGTIVVSIIHRMKLERRSLHRTIPTKLEAVVVQAATIGTSPLCRWVKYCISIGSGGGFPRNATMACDGTGCLINRTLLNSFCLGTRKSYFASATPIFRSNLGHPDTPHVFR